MQSCGGDTNNGNRLHSPRFVVAGHKKNALIVFFRLQLKGHLEEPRK